MIGLIGDVHGKTSEYLALLEKHKYPSVQLGDLGFRPSYQIINDNVIAMDHRFIHGNHDDMTCLPPHFLGRFGFYEHSGVPFFFISGERSIDQVWRTPYIDWWPNEELNEEEKKECVDLYADSKQDIVLSHGCPSDVVDYFGLSQLIGKIPRSDTSKLLSQLWNIYKPKLWIFGHYHTNKMIKIENTTFVCLTELAYATIDKNLKLEYKE